jgi:hypothetical protein
MATLWGKTFNRMELLRRVGDIRQLAGAQAFELVDGAERGTRAVRLYNAAGLDLTVLTDRGMGLAHLAWRGVQLSLLTPPGSVHPAFAEQEGAGWLRTWPAGFVTICGLTQVGGPVQDGEEALGQHGRAANLPASQVSWGGAWDGDEYSVWVEGTLHEAAVFGHHLSLRRRVWMRLDEPRFWIEDRVVNEGLAPAPHMILQHFNLGFPLLDAETRLEIPSGAVEPRDELAQPGIDAWMRFGEPGAGVREQVFYHDLVADAQGEVELRLRNRNFNQGQGLSVYWKYRKADYPVLVEWKNMADGLYVVGIEPANCHVEGRVSERERGTLQVLQPLETRNYRIEVGFDPA